MSKLETIRSEWKSYRSVADGSEDWPTTANSYNPAATVTHRLASRMLTKAEADLEKIQCGDNPLSNALELRARFTTAGATSTFHIFGRRSGDLSAKLIATVTATAGTQVDENGYYHATTLTVTSYWPKSIPTSPVEAGTGMCTLMFDTLGWSDFWIGTTVLSAGTIYFDYAGL
jgi:hypothetical protein